MGNLFPRETIKATDISGIKSPGSKPSWNAIDILAGGSKKYTVVFQ